MKFQVPTAIVATVGRVAAVAGLAVTLTAMVPAISPDVAAPVTDAVSAVMPGGVLLSPLTSEVLAESTSTVENSQIDADAGSLVTVNMGSTSSTVENFQIDWWTAYVDSDGRCRRECGRSGWPCLVIEF